MKNTLSLIIFCVAIVISPQAVAESAKADAILGVWLNAEKDGFIEIIKNSDIYEGVIVGSPNAEDEDRVDINNPDPKLRSRLLRGLVMLQGFRFDGDEQWEDGKIYDPNNGETYRCTLELSDQDKLSVRGYIGIPLFGRTEIWTRKQ